ncbi:hypothetical protein Poly51_37340 [Rubripirellula tenax]|uniref:Uncharacterized protein n=1 Tax=Rubripirellula tenax TaxID=2528015 RepID=A0A5C6F1M7_9BACT|nr:hypothetical protein [Rubripirellula tenax]TWU54985.1 hypothetical protein Poly51_37340 [Rubripirellula tenax]
MSCTAKGSIPNAAQVAGFARKTCREAGNHFARYSESESSRLKLVSSPRGNRTRSDFRTDTSYFNATLAATIGQSETLAMMGDRLAGVDEDKLHDRVMKFMSKSRGGKEPTPKQIDAARREK